VRHEILQTVCTYSALIYFAIFPNYSCMNNKDRYIICSLEVQTHRRNKMIKFAAGKKYSTRSACDHTCVIEVTIVKRTAKTVTTAAGSGDQCGKTFRVSEYDGMEIFSPWGKYSMSPTIRAA
jgi:hypothetical protein